MERYILLVKTGCQWRMFPLDFPKWQLVYYYYRKWASQLDFDLLLEKLCEHVFVKRCQNMDPGVGIIDNQSIKWRNNASLKGIQRIQGVGFRSIQKRWIVERTFTWMDYNRRLCRNDELTFDSAKEMVKLATIKLLLRKI